MALALALPPAQVAIVAGGETYRSQPPLMLYWAYKAPKGFFITSIAWSPDGEKIAIRLGNMDIHPTVRVIVFDADGEVVWDSGEIDGVTLPPTRVSWSPDGRFIAMYFVEVGLTSESLLIIDVETGNTTKIPIRNIMGLAWNPSEDLVAVAASDAVMLVDPSGEVLWRVKVGPVAGIEWNHEGTLLALKSGVGAKVTVVDVKGNILWSKELSQSSLIRDIAWDPLDDYLAVQVEDEGLYVLDRNGDEVWSLGQPFFHFTWSPNSQKLAVAGANLTLYDASGREIWSIPWIERRLTSIVTEYVPLWSPAGDRLIAQFLSGETYVINPATGEITWNGTLIEAIERVEMSPRGDRLAVSKGRMVAVFGPTKELGILEVSRCVPGCYVRVSDGWITKVHGGVEGGVLRLYARPGSYNVTFGLTPILGWMLVEEAVGGGVVIPLDPLIIDGFNKTVEISVGAGETKRITAPIDELIDQVLSSLAQIKFEVAPGVKIYVDGELVTSERVTEKARYIVVFVEPGVHTIEYGGIEKKVMLGPGEVVVFTLPKSSETSTSTAAATTTGASTTQAGTETAGAKESQATEETETAPHPSQQTPETTARGASSGKTLVVAAGIIVAVVIAVIAATLARK